MNAADLDPRHLQALDADIATRHGAPVLTEPDGVMLLQGTDVQPQPISWLWHFWIALGKLLILAGMPGAGKTTLALSWIALCSRGGVWPDGTPCAVGNCLVWSGEDDVSDTLAPRLIAMGADMSRVFFVTGSRVDGQALPFDPARDLVQLDAAADRIGNIKILMVDPVVSAIAGDSHKNAEVRRSLQPLVDLGSRLGAAVIGITHLSKGTAGRDPTERVTGSIAFSAVARIVLLAAKVKGEDGNERRLLVRAKANIAPDDGGYQYHVEQTSIDTAAGEVQTSMVTWGEAIEGSAKQLLTDARDDEDDEGEGSAVDSAKSFLRDLLTVPTPTKKVQEEAKAAGHSWAAVRRASDAMHIIKRKGETGWYWSIPTRSGNLLTKKHEQHGQVEHVEHVESIQGAQVAQDAHLLRVMDAEQVADEGVEL